ncbi:MAG: DUF86 domain-containing protein [Candidatus Shapirobacteria bacterium]
MSIKGDLAYFRHILDAIREIEGFIAGIEEKDFYQDSLRQSGVIRQLEIIGEAASHISKETKESRPDFPWHAAIGMRNKLIHHYFGVDLDAVWKTVKEDLPGLKKTVKVLLCPI